MREGTKLELIPLCNSCCVLGKEVKINSVNCPQRKRMRLASVLIPYVHEDCALYEPHVPFEKSAEPSAA